MEKGYSQKEGFDYNEIISPVVKQTFIRVILSLVAKYDLELDQMNEKFVFLHGNLEEVIYMHQLEGFLDNDCDKVSFKEANLWSKIILKTIV